MFKRESCDGQKSCRASDKEEDIGKANTPSKSLMHVGLSCPLKGVLRFKWSECLLLACLLVAVGGPRLPSGYEPWGPPALPVLQTISSAKVAQERLKHRTSWEAALIAGGIFGPQTLLPRFRGFSRLVRGLLQLNFKAKCSLAR